MQQPGEQILAIANVVFKEVLLNDSVIAPASKIILYDIILSKASQDNSIYYGIL